MGWYFDCCIYYRNNNLAGNEEWEILRYKIVIVFSQDESLHPDFIYFFCR